LCDVRILYVTSLGLPELISRNQVEEDSDLHPLVKQLRSHLESMRNNASQIAGIRDSIVRSQAALNLLPLE
jgi:CENP-Q, a CENPA-CAD centromere complex subunit